MLAKADEIYNQKLAENPNFANELIAEWREDMPENFADYMLKLEYGCHIIDEGFYNKAVSLLEWVDDKGHGAKWQVNDIVKLSGIDFDEKDYYELDYCYVVNMLWSDYCNVFTEPSYYLRMAQDYLEDKDYWSDASERAYKNAKKRIKYS